MSKLRNMLHSHAEGLKTFAAITVGALLVLLVQTIYTPRVTTAESHAVWNFIVENGLEERFGSRFNQVNEKWPPTRFEMAELMLDAGMAASLK